MSLIAAFRDYVDALVHPSARFDALTAARHRAFIGSRVVVSLIALAAIPVYLAVKGAPTVLEVLVLGWLLLPVLNAYYLSRTGRHETAQIFASLSLTVLVAMIAVMTGGVRSFAAVWLVAIPIEAALSASRRAVAVGAAFSLVATALLLALGLAGVLAPAGPHETGWDIAAALGLMSAALYATAVSLRTESLARTSSRLLSQEEARYHLLARNMTDVITRHDGNGAVLFASPAAERLFGASARELSGHGLFDRVHVSDRPAYLTTLAAASAGESRSVEFRVRRDSPEGALAHPRFLWVEMRCRPLDPSGEAAGDTREVVAVMRDVTDRKAQQEIVEEARCEAERANAAKSRFLATMSHELRTPLNSVIGFSDMLINEETLKLDAARRLDYARLINESGNHLLAVVNGILDMSKIETGNFEITPEPFMLAPVIGTCRDLLGLRAQNAGIELRLKLAQDLPEIVADKRAMKQILLNLMSNAIKFTDRGGHVTVSATVEGADIHLTVADTGVGIGEHDLPRLGDPFFQARGSYARPFDGTGLGLSIVKGLVLLHGGRMDFHSRLGEGTEVVIRLPIDCERHLSGREPGKDAGKVVAKVDRLVPQPRVAVNGQVSGQVRKSA